MTLAHGVTILHGNDWSRFGIAVLIAFVVLLAFAVVKIRQRSK